MQLENLKKERKKKNLTLEELSKLIPGTSNQTISNWENGKSEPDIESLKKLSSIFNTSIDYLVNNKIENNSKIKDIQKKIENLPKDKIVELLIKQLDILLILDKDNE